MNAQEMLEKFRDPAWEPELDEGLVTIVGTGGVGLWERLWSKIHAGSQDRNRTMRAMRTAGQEARSTEGKLGFWSTEFHGMTRKGLEMRAMFHRDAGGTGPMQGRRGPERSANRFARRVPGWRQRARELMITARDTLEAGQHLAMWALLEENPEALQAGLRMIHEAEPRLRRRIEGFDRGDRADPPTGIPAGNHHGASSNRRQYLLTMTRTLPWGAPREEVRRSVGTAVAARDLERLHEHNMEPLHGMPRGAARTALRRLNGGIFREDQMKLGRTLAEALRTEDRYGVQDVMERIIKIQDGIGRTMRSEHPGLDDDALARFESLREHLRGPDPSRAVIPVIGSIAETPVRDTFGEALIITAAHHAAAASAAAARIRPGPRGDGGPSPIGTAIAELESLAALLALAQEEEQRR